MKKFFGFNARFKPRVSGSDFLVVLDVRASTEMQARWLARTWKRVVQYVNGTLSEEKDVANILALMHDLGWSPPAQLNSGAERRAFASKMIKVAQEVRTQVREILCWIVNPGENTDRDRRAVNIISEHSHGVKLQLVDGRVVGRSFGTSIFLTQSADLSATHCSG
jgi:hypothetical protein